MESLDHNSIGSLWVEYLTHVLEHGVEVHDQRENILEVDQVNILLSEISKADPIILRYGKPDVIETYIRKMFSHELIPELNSTYGDRFFDNLGVDQIEWGINRLQDNKWAKSCFIPLVIPNDPGPRIPCLSAIQISIRNDSLNIHATFRSQNVFHSYGNFYGLSAIQEFIAKKIPGVSVGKIYCSINFPHIYLSDVSEAKAIVKAELASLE